MAYAASVGRRRYVFDNLRVLLARASPGRSGDRLAGLAAGTEEERVAARMALADVPLRRFLAAPIVPGEIDAVTRLILESHDAAAFAPVAALTVGAFRDWLLSDAATTDALERLAPGLTSEMAAAVSKLMRNQDLIAVARKARVVTRFRNTIGLPGRFSVRLQPNHPTDDPNGIGAAILDGLLYGCGDAVIGVNPATDSAAQAMLLLQLIDELRARFEIPTQSCVLAHVTTTLDVMNPGAGRSISSSSPSRAARRRTAPSGSTSRFWTRRRRRRAP